METWEWIAVGAAAGAGVILLVALLVSFVSGRRRRSRLRKRFGPEYYRAILSDSGVDASRAAVVDDSPKAISWARECGLRAFQVERRAGEEFDDAVARTFEEAAREID